MAIAVRIPFSWEKGCPHGQHFHALGLGVWVGGGLGSLGTPHLPIVSPPLQVQLINDAYNAVVDAVLGAEAELGEGRGPCAGILATLKHVRIPIVSLDVPSGMGTPRVVFHPICP